MQDLTEKRLFVVEPQPLLSDGTVKGEITVPETCKFRVGQVVTLSSDTQPYITLKIKRILKNSTVYLGGENEQIQHRVDISAYKVADNAVIFAREQKRPGVPEQEIERFTYEEEPVVARRVVLIDKYGERYSSTNPVPVYYTDGSNPIIYTEQNTFTNILETVVGTFTATINGSKMFRLMGDAKTFGTWRMYRGSVLDANLFAVDRTSPMHGMCNIKLDQAETLNIADSIIVTFEAERYRTALLGPTAKTFIRLEGFTLTV